jgi:hypothetical protein
MRTLAPVLALTLLLAACSGSSSAPAAVAVENVSVTGKVVERLDESPYSYLRIETQAGPVWTAVLSTSVVELGSKVSVVNGSAVNDVELRVLGRTLQSVVFGTLKRD